MDNLLDNFGLNKNFWVTYPQFLAIEKFREFHFDDKSKQKSYSSKIMWGIAFVVHPASVFSNLDEDDKRALIAHDYIEEDNFDWNKVKDIEEEFEYVVLSKAKKSLNDWEKKLRERDLFISNTKYTAETADLLDKILKNTADLWKQYKNIREDVLAEGNTAVDKGGSTPSLTDEGRI
ncbi:MAG: hypothetical protein KC414_15655 [Romboutsia sp.]|nr:hypothetical protein [Romboutsia sp.]